MNRTKLSTFLQEHRSAALGLAPVSKQMAINMAVTLEAELADYDSSFKLYDDAMRRGTKIWREETGNDRVWPDAAALAAYLIAKIVDLEADLYQALERESRLEFALSEAGLEVGEPWHNNAPGEPGSRAPASEIREALEISDEEIEDVQEIIARIGRIELIPLYEIDSGEPFGYYARGYHDAFVFIAQVEAEYQAAFAPEEVSTSYARIVPLPSGRAVDSRILFNQKAGRGAFFVTYVLYD